MSVEQLGRLVRQLYVSCRRGFDPAAKGYGETIMPHWDGDEDRWGTKHAAVWPKIARLVMQQQLNPVVFVYVQFSETRGHKIPKPNMLLADDALERYRRYTSNIVQQLKDDFARQSSALQLRLSELKGHGGTELQQMITALHDHHTIDAGPLFRYCAACMAGLEHVAERYRVAALSEYAFQQEHFDAAWGAHIPEALRQEAAALRAKLAY